MTKPRNLTISLAATITCIFFVYFIGVTHLKYDPIWGDEYRSLSHVVPPWEDDSRSVLETIGSVSRMSSQHAPLYFVFLNSWEELAGKDVFSLRLLSTFFGALSLALVFRLATITGNSIDARAAVFVLAFHAFYGFYSHELRMYTMLGAASSWTAWSYWKLTHNRPPSRWKWLSLLLGIMFLLYTHYMGAVLLAAIGLYHLLFVKRDRSWWQVMAILALGGITFLPWLQVVISGVTEHIDDYSVNPLTRLEAMRAVLAFLANGLTVAPIALAGFLFVKRRQLVRAERFMIFVTGTTVVLLFILNEFVPVLVEWRVRYIIVVLPLLCCITAVAARLLPNWPFLRPLLALAWIGAYIFGVNMENAATEKGVRPYTYSKTPHYQDFVYHADDLPGHNELILSFHPYQALSDGKQLPYYRELTSKWEDITHLTYDSDGELVIQYGLSSHASLDAISANSNGIWVIYDPKETDLMAMPVYADWFLQHFKICKRFLERDVSNIDYYVKLSVPCELITDDQARGIAYDNETELANYVVEEADDELAAYLWWRHTDDKRYSFSLQIFDEKAALVGQHDQKISGEPIDIVSIDTSSLPAGDYTVHFIVYEFETLKSQPGRMLLSGESFDRVVEIYRFTIDA